MSGKGLDDYLKVYKLPCKLDHDYIDLQKRLSHERSDITDLVEYCLYDCEALLLLDQASSITAKAFSMMNLLGVPLSYGLWHTDKNCLELRLQRAYSEEGYAVAYTAAKGVENQGYSGAYTSTVATVGQVYTEVFAPDFASLYPNALISANACVSSWIPRSKDRCHTVDVSDDKIYMKDCEQKHIYFDEKEGVCTRITKAVLAERVVIKSDLNRLSKGSAEWTRLNTKQLAVKVVANTLYGLCGSRASPLFWRPVATAITAYGRKAIKTAIDVMNSRGHTFLCADTDSAISTMASRITMYTTLKCECVPVDPIVQSIKLSELATADYTSITRLDVEMMAINAEVQRIMGSSFLNLEIEEVVRSIAFMEGKKSYYCLNAVNDDKALWIRGCPIASTGPESLKIRGASWSKQHDSLRTWTRSALVEFLLDGKATAQAFWQQKKDEISAAITNAVVTCDHTTLSVYAERVKLSSEKSPLVAYLKSSYALLLQDQSICQVVMLQGSGSKTFRKIPLQAISPSVSSRIDTQELVSNAMAVLTKLVLSNSEKRIVAKQSLFKLQQGELQDSLGEDEIIVRLEKTKNGKTGYTLEKWTMASVANRLSKLKGVAAHELLTSGDCRLFFDIDGDSTLDEFTVLEQLDTVVRSQLGMLPMRRVLRSSGEKRSYHVYYDVVTSLQYAKVIATVAQQSIPYIDTAVYRAGGSLRMPNSIKITDNQVIDRRFNCSHECVAQHLITPSQSMVRVDQPLHHITTPVIDSFYRMSVDVNDKDVLAVTRWAESKGIRAQVFQTDKCITIKRVCAYTCPIHDRIHDNENLYAVVQKKAIVIKCYRSSAQDAIKSIKIDRITVDEEMKSHESRLHEMVDQC